MAVWQNSGANIIQPSGLEKSPKSGLDCSTRFPTRGCPSRALNIEAPILRSIHHHIGLLLFLRVIGVGTMEGKQSSSFQVNEYPMGEFRFRVPIEWNLDPYHGNSIHVIGLDGIPWPCRIAVSDDPMEPQTRKLVSVSRNRDESGRLFVLYSLADRGEMLICTGTLPVREQPYELLTELARGTLNRLRNQISIWEEGGLEVSDSVRKSVFTATHFLSESILCTDTSSRDNSARRSIETTMDAIFELSQSFGRQISEFRREHEEMSSFWMANVLGFGDEFEPSLAHVGFDLLEVCLNPEDVHQAARLANGRAEELGKRIIVGPWLDASVGGMSQSLIDVPDFHTRKTQLLIECRRQLNQIPSTTSLIHVVSGLNGIGHRHLSYPQQLQVAVDMLRLVEESKVELPTLISFDFPWAERLAGAVGGVHPLQIADSLMRQGLPISFLGLDINLDYWPNGSAVRDPLQWIDLIDVWAQLGLPLVICLRTPIGEQHNTIPVDIDRQTNQLRSNLTDEDRINFLNTVMPMMIARPSVHGMIWRQWSDLDDPRFPRGGLVDVTGASKKINGVIDNMRAAIHGDG